MKKLSTRIAIIALAVMMISFIAMMISIGTFATKQDLKSGLKTIEIDIHTIEHLQASLEEPTRLLNNQDEDDIKELVQELNAIGTEQKAEVLVKLHKTLVEKKDAAIDSEIYKKYGTLLNQTAFPCLIACTICIIIAAIAGIVRGIIAILDYCKNNY